MATSSWTLSVRNTFVHLASDEAVEETLDESQPVVSRSKTAPMATTVCTVDERADTETPEVSEQASSAASDGEWQSGVDRVTSESSLDVADGPVQSVHRRNAGGVRRRVSWASEVSVEFELPEESDEDQPSVPVARRNRRSATWHAELGLPAYVVPLSSCSPKVAKGALAKQVVSAADSPVHVDCSEARTRQQRRSATWHPTTAEASCISEVQPMLERVVTRDPFESVDALPQETMYWASEEASPQPNLHRFITRDFFDDPKFLQVETAPAQQGSDDESSHDAESSGDVKDEQEAESKPLGVNTNVASMNGFMAMQPWFFPHVAQWNMQFAGVHAAQMNSCAIWPASVACAASAVPPQTQAVTKPMAGSTSISQPSRAARKSTSKASGSSLTTVMMRNVPNNYTRGGVMELLDAQGFTGMYDFLYFPIDFETHAALGYAFINFVSSEAAEEFHEKFEGFSQWSVPSGKVCTVAWTQQEQGLEAHVQRYRNSPLMHELVPDEYRPVLLQNGRRVPFPEPTKKIKPPRKGTKLMLV